MTAIHRIPRLFCGFVVLILAGAVRGGDLSPAKWPAAERERAEKRESAGWTPTSARSITGRKGLISAIASPIAVQAGIECSSAAATLPMRQAPWR